MLYSRTGYIVAFSCLLALIFMGRASAQESKLPPCPTTIRAEQLNNCFGPWVVPNVYVYFGEWQQGKEDGQGTITFIDGEQYRGEFRDGKRNGTGTDLYANGNKYAGEFKDDVWDGHGTFSFVNGDKYVGEFKAGKFNGHGTYSSSDGGTFVGDYEDGVATGQGARTFGAGQWSGDQYVGEFKAGIFSGKGTYTYKNGERYVGEFSDNKWNGRGEFFKSDGSKFVGDYKDGKPNGQGVIYAANGQIIQQGIFENGILTSSAASQASSSAASQSSSSSNRHSVPMVIDAGTYTVPVTINEVLTLHFVVDSGAADVSIPSDVVLTLVRTGTIRPTDFIGNQKYQLADGSTVDSQQFIVRSLKVGDQTVENVRASISDIKGSLLLGQSFLQKFKSWSMDNTNHELVLQ